MPQATTTITTIAASLTPEKLLNSCQDEAAVDDQTCFSSLLLDN